jgi:hypothetical protein
MARPSRATQEKRNRERSQKEKQQEKIMERALRKEVRSNREAMGAAGSIDPDLIGIYPGPQPPRED